MTDPAKKPFQDTAYDRDTGVFDHEQEVLRIWRDFPVVKDTIYFIDISAYKPIYPDAGFMAEKKKKEILSLMGSDRGLSKEIAFRHSNRTSSTFQSGKDGGLFVLLFQNGTDTHLFRAAIRQQVQAFVFDHEVGHALVPGGTPSANDDARLLSENIADAYAVIRHFQRYGTDSSAIGDLVATRACHFILEGHNEYFTSPVVEQILMHRNKMDWNRLSPAETVTLARKFAVDHAVKPEFMAEANEAFKDFRQTGDLKTLFQAVQSAENPLLSKWGKLVLRKAFNKAAAKKPPESGASPKKEDQKKFLP